jgi:hypothetical protein
MVADGPDGGLRAATCCCRDSSSPDIFVTAPASIDICRDSEKLSSTSATGVTTRGGPLAFGLGPRLAGGGEGEAARAWAGRLRRRAGRVEAVLVGVSPS